MYESHISSFIMAWWPGGSVSNYQTTFLPHVYNLTQSGHSRIWWKLSSNRNMSLFPRTKHRSQSISNQNFKLQMTHTWWTWQTLTYHKTHKDASVKAQTQSEGARNVTKTYTNVLYGMPKKCCHHINLTLVKVI